MKNKSDIGSDTVFENRRSISLKAKTLRHLIHLRVF